MAIERCHLTVLHNTVLPSIVMHNTVLHNTGQGDTAPPAEGRESTVSRPPHARDKVLDAFENLLLTEGPRTATLDAVARHAGVSKGGLLYHFASRDALEAGLIDRMHDLTRADIDQMLASPDGVVHTFLRTSAFVGTPLDRAISATARLSSDGSTVARDALRDLRTRWGDMLRPHVTSAAALDLILLLSDGLYVNSAVMNDVPGPVPEGADLTEMIDLAVSISARDTAPQPE